MANKDKFTWPEIFIDENFDYPLPIDDEHLSQAIADGLAGWGNCYAGAKAPDNFGRAMVKIAQIVGSTLPDDLMKAADDLIKRK